MTTEIRADDILQSSNFSRDQRKSLERKTFFEWFLEADKFFEKTNYPCILAILSEGLDEQPEWVEYIKKHIDRYLIELHGLRHWHYNHFNAETGYKLLKEAKYKIEKTFDRQITSWYVPFGRKGAPLWGKEICDKLGIKFDVPTQKIDIKVWLKYRNFNHMNFHFWSEKQVRQLPEVLKLLT